MSLLCPASKFSATLDTRFLQLGLQLDRHGCMATVEACVASPTVLRLLPNLSIKDHCYECHLCPRRSKRLDLGVCQLVHELPEFLDVNPLVFRRICHTQKRPVF